MLSVSSCGAARVTSPRLLLIVYSPLKRSEVTATTSIFLSHPPGPFFSEHKEEQRATAGAAEAEGWVVWLEGELVAAAAAVAVEVVGSGIRKKKYRKGEQRSDSTDKERRQGRGVAVSFWGGGGGRMVGG